jgi:hypothetical protein
MSKAGLKRLGACDYADGDEVAVRQDDRETWRVRSCINRLIACGCRIESANLSAYYGMQTNCIFLPITMQL